MKALTKSKTFSFKREGKRMLSIFLTILMVLSTFTVAIAEDNWIPCGDNVSYCYRDGNLVFRVDNGDVGKIDGIYEDNPLNLDPGTGIDFDGEGTILLVGNADKVFRHTGTINCQTIYGLSHFDVTRCDDLSGMFENFSRLTDLGPLCGWDVSNVTNMKKMFYQCSGIEILAGLESWEVSNVTDMGAMFYKCSALENLDQLSGWNTASLTETVYQEGYNGFRGLFQDCKKIQSLAPLRDWNVSNVTDMTNMFYQCTGITSLDGLENWDTGNVLYLERFLYGCTNLESLEELRNWNVSSVRILSEAFKRCIKVSSLKPLSNWNTSNVRLMDGTFFGMTGLKDSAAATAPAALEGLENWNTSNVTSMQETFKSIHNINNLEPLKSWNTSNVTRMTAMFYDVCNLNDFFLHEDDSPKNEQEFKGLDLSGLSFWDVSKVQNMGQIFGADRIRSTEPISDWNVSGITSSSGVSQMFGGTYQMLNFDLSGLNLRAVNYAYLSWFAQNSTFARRIGFPKGVTDTYTKQDIFKGLTGDEWHKVGDSQSVAPTRTGSLCSVAPAGSEWVKLPYKETIEITPVITTKTVDFDTEIVLANAKNTDAYCSDQKRGAVVTIKPDAYQSYMYGEDIDTQVANLAGTDSARTEYTYTLVGDTEVPFDHKPTVNEPGHYKLNIKLYGTVAEDGYEFVSAEGNTEFDILTNDIDYVVDAHYPDAAAAFDETTGTGIVYDNQKNYANSEVYSAVTPSEFSSWQGSHFGGWYTDSTRDVPFVDGSEITEKTNLYAKWSYDVTFDDRGGTGGVGGQTVVAEFGRDMPEITSVPTREGYIFGGYGTLDGEIYYTPDSFSAKQYDINSPTTLYALWTPKTINLHFLDEHGSETDIVVPIHNVDPDAPEGTAVTIPLDQFPELYTHSNVAGYDHPFRGYAIYQVVTDGTEERLIDNHTLVRDGEDITLFIDSDGNIDRTLFDRYITFNFNDTKDIYIGNIYAGLYDVEYHSNVDGVIDPELTKRSGVVYEGQVGLIEVPEYYEIVGNDMHHWKFLKWVDEDENEITDRQITITENRRFMAVYEIVEHTEPEGSRTEPTCTTAGILNYTCPDCGHVVYEETPIDPGAHPDGAVESFSAVRSNCVEAGNYEYTHCTLCDLYTITKDDGTVISEKNALNKTVEPINPESHKQYGVDHPDYRSNHDEKTHDVYCSSCLSPDHLLADDENCRWDDGVQTKPPTCEEEGEKTYTCLDCGQTRTEPVSIIPHHLVKVDDSWPDYDLSDPPNCIRGQAYYKECDMCGMSAEILMFFDDSLWDLPVEDLVWISDEVDPDNHDEDGVNNPKYISNEDGETHDVICSACNNHDHALEKNQLCSWVSHDHKDASCTEEGYDEEICSKCGQIKRTTIAKTEHVFTVQDKTHLVGNPADCITAASWYLKCENCDTYANDESLNGQYLDKVWSDGKKDDTRHVGPLVPKSNEDGKTHHYYCDACTATVKDTEMCAWNDGEVIKEATKKEKGTIRYTCTVCGQIKEDDIPVLPHDHEDTDGDYYCDICGYDMHVTIDNCGCICHWEFSRDPFIRRFGKVMYHICRVFWKLFRVRLWCECGRQHYFPVSHNYEYHY